MVTRRHVGTAVVVVAAVALLIATLSRHWWARRDELLSVHVGLVEVETCLRAEPSEDMPRRYVASGPRCSTESLADSLKGGFKRFVWAARIELVLAVSAVLALLVLAVLAAARRRTQGAVWVCVGLAGTAFIGGIVGIASLPRAASAFHLAVGAYVALAACVVAIGGALALLGEPRQAPLPALPEVLAPPVVQVTPVPPMVAAAIAVPMDEPRSGLVISPERAWQRPASEPTLAAAAWAPAPALASSQVLASPAGPPSPPPSSATIAPACPRCTAPTLFVSRHGRWFCSSCRIYVQPA